MSSPTDALADAIADRVWIRLQAKLESRLTDKALISLSEAATKLGISKEKARQMIGTGDFPKRIVRRIGRRIMLSSEEFHRWLDAQ